MGRLKALIPWWAKILLKIGLSRLPFPYRIWKELGLFENGPMEQADYALNVFNHHFELCQRPREFTCLELGPGDSLSSALIGLREGAKKVYLVDVADFASKDLGQYRAVAGFLGGSDFQRRIDWTTRDTMLMSCRAEYLTSGIESLKGIPDNSCDYIWSQAVLEHVRRSEFALLLDQLHRVLKSDGHSSHVVDLRDHLANSLNNLRFSEKLWESRCLSRSGFYTNRIRFSEMMTMFENAEFSAKVISKDLWSGLPLARRRLAPEYRSLSDDELRVAGFTVVLRRRASQ
jgi:SAM-dependent methyltransferase